MLETEYHIHGIQRIFPLPLHEEFFNQLQDRLHTCVERTLFLGDTRFTIILNVIPRDKEQQYDRDTDSPTFIYGGCETQRLLLEKWADIPQTKEYNDAWNYLAKSRIEQENSEQSASFYTKIQKGELSIQDFCKIYTLKSYFSKGTREYTKEQSSEKTILSSSFSIEDDLFISVPLIGYAEFDGVAHIVFKKELLESILTKNLSSQTYSYDYPETMPYASIWQLILAFMAEYDGLFLEWDFHGENLEKITATNFFLRNIVEGTDEYFGQKRNPIFKELKLQQHYQRHLSHYLNRLKLNENLPGKIYQQYITNAVTAILIDSYSHNVSAHALSTLSWWYARRAKRLKEDELNWEVVLDNLRKKGGMSLEAIDAFENALADRRKQSNPLPPTQEDTVQIRTEDGLQVVQYPGSLSREMSKLLRFLTEKGAYWGGITRDVNVGGRIISLYNVLWHDFINNPFYIGTIAKTEDILKIGVKIVLYEPERQENRGSQTYYHKKHYNPENCGILGWVDLTAPRQNLKNDNSLNHGDVLSAFVNKGEHFDRFREALRKIKVFFPGDVVGRHALYTMIENEIRNVKHYSRAALEKLREEGLTVAIGIEPCSLHNSKREELYRISIWLDTPTPLHEGEKHLILQKWESLKGEILNAQTKSPLLGGTQQDKICAGFLLNGSFSSVQRGDKNPVRDKSRDIKRDENYYPWVRPACSVLETEEEAGVHKDYKMSYNTPIEPIQLPQIGFLKKMFHLWRGERLLEWDGDNISDWDNISRFTIVSVPTLNHKNLLELRRDKGIVRIVQGPLPTDGDELVRYAAAYKHWLYVLLGKPSLYALRIVENDKPIYLLGLKQIGGELRFVYEQFGNSAHQTASLDEESKNQLRANPNASKTLVLPLAHKSGASVTPDKHEIKFRSHGILRNYFLPEGADIPQHIDDTRMMELLETFATKVCIFDNRVYHRMRLGESDHSYHAFLRSKMKFSVHQEIKESKPGELRPQGVSGWKTFLSEEEREFMENCHFLVMHLSFIESILKHEDPKLHHNDASNVGLFIEREILPFVQNRDNFFFVVTTGRGRNEWWTTIKTQKNYPAATFTLFRPIESILTAIENSLGMEDDVELKYRIVKILSGS